MESLQKCKPLDQVTRKRKLFDPQGNTAHLAHRRALQALIIASAERLKNLFVQEKCTRTLCFWTIHVTNENNSAIVIPTISGECAAHRNCSQLFHTCPQRQISFCRDVEIRDS